MSKFLFVVLIVVSANAYAGTAEFTGRAETSRNGVNCQYSYQGNYFWVQFKNTCPRYIEVD